MAVEYISIGSVAANAAAITVGLPASRQTDDLLLLLVETANQDVTLTGTDSSNWVQLTSSPQGTGTAAGTAATRLTVYYRWVDGTEANIGVGDSGDHQIAQIINYRGVDTTNPFNAQAGSTRTTAGTTVTYPSVVTTVDDCMVLLMEAHSLPDSNSTAITSGYTNANLTSITERMDQNTNAGNGGGFSLAEGIKATAGTVGTSSATTTSSVGGMITLALKPAPLPTRTGDLAATETGSDTFSSNGDVFVKGSLAATETGSDTFAASGTVRDPAITGTFAATETGTDVLAATGKVIVKGSLAVTETGQDTFTATGDVIVQGTLAATETASDIFVATGGAEVAGILSVTETASDAFTSTGDVFVVGSFSASEAGDDLFAGSGFVIIQGNLTASEAGLDTFEAVQGALNPEGSLAATEAGPDYFGLYVEPGYVEDGYFDIGVTGTLGRIGGMAAVESGGGTAFGTNAVMKYYNGTAWITLLKDPTVYT